MRKYAGGEQQNFQQPQLTGYSSTGERLSPRDNGATAEKALQAKYRSCGLQGLAMSL